MRKSVLTADRGDTVPIDVGHMVGAERHTLCHCCAGGSRDIGLPMRSFLIVTMVLAACDGGGSGEPDLSDYDARCVAVCTDDPPAIEGAGDVCSGASRTSCLELCEARIAGQMSLCQTCLLEGAYYGTGGEDGPGGFCDNTSCTITGRNGSCTYPPNDTAKREMCERQVNPRREVPCDVEFEPVSQCASSCQM